MKLAKTVQGRNVAASLHCFNEIPHNTGGSLAEKAPPGCRCIARYILTLSQNSLIRVLQRGNGGIVQVVDVVA